MVKVRDRVRVKIAEPPSVTWEGEAATVTVGPVVKAAVMVWQEQTAAREAKAAKRGRAKTRRLEITVNTINTIEQNPCARCSSFGTLREITVSGLTLRMRPGIAQS